jgi:mannose-1-phosphate guanylyltransferase/mannose-6-phosphate isomerase
MTSIVPLILSGGSGTRLWPLSRELLPKQLLSLTGDGQTMLQATVARLHGLEKIAQPLIVCNEEHRFLIAEQLRRIGVSGARIVLEPVGRNTAAAIAAAAVVSMRSGDDPLLLVLPADHVIGDPDAFRAAVERARGAAEQGWLVTFGIVPRLPETGYGYLRVDRATDSADFPSDVRRISRFVEKPDRATAEVFLSEGGYLWNSGMFLFRASRYLEELQRYAADIHAACQEAVQLARDDLDFVRLEPKTFAACRADSIDYAVMEKTDRAVVTPLDAAWSDVGSWSSLHEALPLDAEGNALRGDVIAADTHNSLVLAESRLVATVGLTGHVVVETKDAVLVAPRDRVQDVKAIVARLKADGRSESQTHREVHRPWGSYDSLDQGVGYQVKRLTVKAGASISLQLHHRRAEHWVVVSGRARITRGEEVFDLERNQSTYIPLGVRHRIENPGSEPLHIIEVQSGDYLGEDDIVRFEDRYGRG